MKYLKGPLFIWILITFFQVLSFKKKLHPSKQLASSSLYLSFKIEYECSQIHEHQFISDYNHKL